MRAEKADQLPPHSHEAEQGVLGCVLLSQDGIGECIERIRPDDFYDLRHQTIYAALLEMYDTREAIDLITLQQRLKDRQLLEQVGGIAYLSGLPDTVPSSANLSYYLEIVAEKSQLRRLIHSCTYAVAAAYQKSGDPKAIIERHEREVLDLLAKRHTEQLPIKEVVKQSIQHIEMLHAKKGADGIPTGFLDLDRLTCGLHDSEMIVIAGRPSAGKTALSMNIAEHVAVDLALPTGVFSLEMSAEALVMRMLCARAKVDAQRVRQGALVESDFPKLAVAASAIARSPLYIDDTPGLSVIALRSKARRLHQLYGIKLFVIDYLQLMVAGRRIEGRQQEVAAISGGIKALARELNVPIIILSQLNRDMEKGGGRNSAPRKPRLSDLRDSGAVEQDADVVLLLWKPGEGEEGEGSDAKVEAVLAKQRNGPTGDIPLIYLRENTRFVNAARE